MKNRAFQKTTQYDLCYGKRSYIIPEEVKKIIDEFEEGVQILYQQWWPKRKYNYIKNKLFVLNTELDNHDTDLQNVEDREKYDSLSDFEQTIFLINDIFDKYRPANYVQIYFPDENQKIKHTLEVIKTLVNMKWLDSLFCTFDTL